MLKTKFILFIGLFLILFLKCRKEELIEDIILSSGHFQDITATSVKLSGKILQVGKGITQYGHCYSTYNSPSLVDINTQLGTKWRAGEYKSIITGLEPDTKYYYCSYAMNEKQIEYGEVYSFTTLSLSMPIVITLEPEYINTKLTPIKGEITSLGLGTDSLNNYGFIWSMNKNPDVYDSIISFGIRDKIGSFEGALEKLEPGITYYYKAFAENNCGKSYGEIKSLKPNIKVPTVKTSTIHGITYHSAYGGGVVESDGGSNVSSRGICWNTTGLPDLSDHFTIDGFGKGEFPSYLDSLSVATEYYIRSYAINSIGIAFGDQVIISTETIETPKVKSLPVSKLKYNSVCLNGFLENNGGASITELGFCWGTTQKPDINDSHLKVDTVTGTFSRDLVGLDLNTTYYMRSYAKNYAGIAYGKIIKFITITPHVIDYDGNGYGSVTIGNQIWMSENLKTTHYADGTPLLNGTGKGNIQSDITTKYWFVYEDDPIYKNDYGLLYTWKAAMNNSNTEMAQGTCPDGWHIPSTNEWKTLIEYLGGGSVAGEKIKKEGSVNWRDPNIANNESGFSALGSGQRRPDGYFMRLKTEFFVWSSTETAESRCDVFWVYNSSSNFSVGGSTSKLSGGAIRCLKD